MRITPQEVKAFKNVLNLFLAGSNYSLYLYGSRVRDDLKGGDIDLIVITDAVGCTLFENKNLDILVHMKNHPDIGQRKIDIKSCQKTEILTDPFLKSISEHWLKI